MSITDCLYENFMSIENVDSKERQEKFTDMFYKIRDWDDIKNISYMDFLPANTLSEESASKYMKEYLKQHV